MVGVHHDAKLVPYYTIQLRDGKEKQTDGKHLNHVKDDVLVGTGGGSGSTSENNNSKGKSGSGTDRGSSCGGGEVEAEAEVGGGSKSTGSDNDTDPMTESSGESNVKDKSVDCGKLARRESGEETSSHEHESNNNPAAGQHGTKNFTEGQDAYYRSPDGSIAKVRIKSIPHDSSTKKNRYTISLPDGSHLENVKQSHLATLMELSSKELSQLMKERNKRQPFVRRSSSSSHGDSTCTDKGKYAEATERMSSSTSDLSDSLNDLDIKKRLEDPSQPTKPSSDPSESNKEHASSARIPVVRMVQAKTEDGKSKTVPLYEAGMALNYKNAEGVTECTILTVHLDDLLEPYYDVRLKDGREKQTDNAHLMLKPDNVGEDGEGDKVNEQEGVGDASGEDVKCRAPPKEQQQHGRSPSNVENVISPSSSKKEVPEDADDNGCPDNTNPSDTQRHPKEDTTSSSLSNSTGFSTGNEVIYTSSEGEQIRAVVLKLHHDKKNRPYYIIRLLSTGKEKHVYGHRLQLCPSQDGDEQQPQSRRSRSRSRGGVDPSGNDDSGEHERGRSSSKASKSESNAGSSNRRIDPAPRSESIDSRRSSLSNSSRRAADRKEKLSARRERDESRTRERHAHDPIGTTSRSRSMSALRQGRTLGRSSAGGGGGNAVAESRGKHPRGESRERSRSRARGGEGKEQRSSSRAPGEGRERSRSRAPGEGRERPCSRAPSEDSRASSSHGGLGSTSRPTQALPNSKKSNSSSDKVSSSSNQLSPKDKTTSEVDASVAGRSIAKLKSFRRSFSAMKKR